jgi:predicted nucleic acid-binding protein
LSGFLLDTNVISMLSPSYADRDESFVRWLHAQERADALFLSVVTIHEIAKGVSLLKNRDAVAKARALEGWLDALTSHYSDRILSFDIAIAALAGELEAHSLSAGHTPGMADAMIAATAKINGLTVVTHNVRDFRNFAIDVRTPADVSA